MQANDTALMTKLSAENLMPIGRFAASCRLSIKALRHYDEQKLLIPAYIDPNTGYRYYRRDQAHTAVAISMLRSLDFSVPMIRELLQAEPPTAESILDSRPLNSVGSLHTKNRHSRLCVACNERNRCYHTTSSFVQSLRAVYLLAP